MSVLCDFWNAYKAVGTILGWGWGWGANKILGGKAYIDMNRINKHMSVKPKTIQSKYILISYVMR